ncbi:efflux RND transporter periplasmic adaptor subunit [bacterium]|nr:efflux RND transporter periplasmic adaptor subunit [bacterium]
MKKLLMVCLTIVSLSSLIYGVSIETHTVMTGEIQEKLTFSGSVKPFLETFVTSDIRGFVKKILVDNGMKVKKNDVMVIIDSARFKNTLRQCLSMLKIKKQAAKECRSDMERSKILIKKKVINQKKYESSETLYVQAKSSQDRAQASCQLAKLDLSRCSIRSMIDGYFVNRNVFEGQAVSSASVLGKVIDLNKVYVEVKIPENKIQLLKIGQTCKIEESYLAKVSHIDLYADNTRSFLVKLLMDNKDLRFKANMFVKGNIIVNHYKDIPLIPMSSLIYEKGEYSVFVAKDGKATRKNVEIIAREGDKCYAKGIKTGDELVVTGQFSLKDGIDVEIAEESRAENAEKKGK